MSKSQGGANAPPGATAPPCTSLPAPLAETNLQIS